MVDLINLVQTLTSPHSLDRYLELVRPTLTVRDMRAEITHTDRSVPGSVTLTLRPTRQWKGHTAGQYVQIGVVIDGVRHARCYSPVDPENGRDRRIQLTVKAHPGGLVSQFLYRDATPGMVVDLTPADGVFRPRAAPGARTADQRRQRHHAGAVYAAHVGRRGPPGRGRVPALREIGGGGPASHRARRHRAAAPELPHRAASSVAIGAGRDAGRPRRAGGGPRARAGQRVLRLRRTGASGALVRRSADLCAARGR